MPLSFFRLAVPGRAMSLLAVALAAAGCVSNPPAPVLQFTTTGGDAWTFAKPLEVTIAPAGACDSVVFTTSRGRITAQAAADRAQFAARVPLDAGDNRVEAACARGGEVVARIAQHWQERLADLPRASAQVTAAGGEILLDAADSGRAPAHPAPLIAYRWRARQGNPAPLPGLPRTGRRIALAMPHVDGRYYATLQVTDAADRSDDTTVGFRVRGGKAEAIDPQQDAPDWARAAVVYGVDPFVFGRHGFADVTARLGALAQLGATVLWLAPVAASAPDDFGYAVTDPFRLRADFGSAADLHRLVAAAHARGMKVILDMVANHLSDRSAYFKDAQRQGPVSPYFDDFARDRSGKAAHYFDWSNLENLNYSNPEVEALVIAAFEAWLRRFDVDGFRVDAAWGPAERDPAFWPRWRAALKRVNPDILLLAEASARDPYFYRNGFDAAYDWTDRLGEWAWQAAFDHPTETASRLRAAIAADGMPPNGLVFRFLDNNDTGPRFITRYGLARTRVASAMLLTLPGLPALYTGDEVGAAFEPYGPRFPISWRDPDELRSWYGRLIQLRRRLPALQSARIRLLDLVPRDRLLAYERPGRATGKSILVLLNYGAAPLRLAWPEDKLGRQSALTDLLTCMRIARGAPIAIPGDGVRILAGDGAPACHGRLRASPQLSAAGTR